MADEAQREIEVGSMPLARPVSPKESDPATKSPEDDKAIVKEAHDRFTTSATWESVARQRWLQDLKFAEGDSENQYQWPNAIRRERDIDERPCLTINKTRQHNLQIINEAKQNKPSIKFRATGGGATVDSAKILNAIARHVEYVSKAQTAYDTATGFQVKAGLGYIKIATDYENPDSFDQMPLIERVRDPLTIYVDPYHTELDGTDAEYAFEFEDMDDEAFKQKYPEFIGAMTQSTLNTEIWGWRKDNFVRLAWYYRKVKEPDVLYAIPVPNKPTIYFRESELRKVPELIAQMKVLPGVRSRATTNDRVEWYLIVGDTIVDRGRWVGKYVPFIPVVGEESVIEGQLDRKGHTRALIDPQRMYNYMSSIGVEYSNLQSKSPYIGPVEAIEGLETYWESANKVNHSILPFNGLDDAGNKIEAPRRAEPPVPMPAAIEGMKIASSEMMMASGQYEAEFGQKSNERSAKAINERERASSTSTYHFVDNLATAIRGVGVHLMDLIPKLYDTKRILNIVGEDGVSYELLIDPTMMKSVQVHQAADANATQQILFNPNVGRYDVQADVGPDWGTKRQETFNALSLILTQAPQLTAIIGDLLLQSSDFDLAEEAASRLRRMVPPQALGTGPTPTEQQLQAQLQNVTMLLKQTMEELATEKIKVKGKDALRQIDAYRAFTERLHEIAIAAEKAGKAIDPQDLAEMTEQVVSEALKTPLTDVIEATGPTLDAAAIQGQGELDLPPMPGARKAPDGKWYVQHQSGFARVE